MVPTTASPPLFPFTAHLTVWFETPATAAVNCWVPPRGTEAVEGEMVTDAEEVTFTAAEAFLVLSATDTATTLTTAGLGTAAGAIYIPFPSIVPKVGFPPGMLLTCHVTRVSVLPKTLA